MITCYVGYDPRESLAYHAWCQSVITHTTEPVAFIPLHRPMLANFDGQRDGTNAFIFSRFLVPYLSGYKGWALFVDGDMIVLDDLAKLWALRDEKYAVQVVPHEYETSAKRKFIGSPLENDNVNYPRKNWSSVILFNCGHPSNRIMSREFVTEASGQFLHRFQWLKDTEVGTLPMEWNHLVSEPNQYGIARLAHFTLGVPGFKHYQDAPYNLGFHKAVLDVLNIAGERPDGIVRRAQENTGAVR